MKNLSTEILFLCEIASEIASDNFDLIETKIKLYKRRNLSAIKLYECILQSYLFCGFPAAIESMKVFRKHFKDFSVKKTSYNLLTFRANGKINCKLIYKKNYKKLIANMNSYSPDIKNWMIIEGYGKVLGRKGMTLLERELINVAILCTRFYENQLLSHLKGSLNLKATKENLKILISSLAKNVSERNIRKTLELIERI